MPLRLPFGPNPLDPRQPQRQVVIPQKLPPKNIIYTKQSPASPVHLSASLVLPSGSNGAVPAAAMKNPMGQDMELLEVKFEISGLDGESFHAEGYGGSVWCELVMGGIKITNGAIPVWNFGRAENIDGEQQTGSLSSVNRSFLSYSWRLPRPFFIPAGAALVPNFTHTGIVPDTLNVRIGYSARTVFTKPKTIYVPWVAKYASKVFNPINEAAVDQSAELDLVNPNPEPLHLQRFVGRTLAIMPTGGMQEFAPEFFGGRTLTMRMSDSYGRPIVRSFTTFRSVFSPLTRSWELDNGAELDPESFYRVQLNVTDIDIVDEIDGATGQAFISMVGWRELEGL